MKTTLLDSGLHALLNSRPLSISHFEVGTDLPTTVDTSKADPYGTVIYASTLSDITYHKHHTNALIFNLHVPELESVGSVVLYLNGRTPFTVTLPATPIKGFPFVIKVIVSIANVESVFNLAPLSEESVTLQRFQYTNNVLLPHEDQHLTAVIEKYRRYDPIIQEYPVLIQNVRNRFYGVPMQPHGSYDTNLDGGILYEQAAGIPPATYYLLLGNPLGITYYILSDDTHQLSGATS